MRAYPEKDEFCKLAEKHNILPVYTELLTDMETPVSLYYKLVGDEVGFILESAETNKTFGRYSFIGAAPFATVTARQEYSEIKSGKKTVKVEGSPTTVLRDFMQTFSFPDLPGLPPFTGGGVGYFAYESVATWERIRGMQTPEETVLSELLFCQVIVVMDHLTHSIKLMYLARVEPGKAVDEIYDKTVAELKEWIKKLRQPAVYPQDNMAMPRQGESLPIDEIAQEKFTSIVEKAKEHILAGDIFQVVLSQQFRSKLKKHPFSLYRRLRQVNPSPYMFYINFGERKLVGASPEMLVKLSGEEVLTYPIAGTRPRGKDGEEDALLAAELLADTKEKAEHAMLVDLGRNDIGRISLPGTVQVRRMMEIEKFSHVMHMVSEVAGRIHPKFKAVDVLSACFPAGTVSGAPKARAMEIIHDLENLQRGPYAGAVGYLDFKGNMDTCITIRTMVIDGDEVVIQTGAGIVADSVPEKEYLEVLQKAKVLFQVIGEDDEDDHTH
ncbi:anthranilate synthase component I [Pelosinus sp. sgz500959]|uniref:anthranilate synthase component I n=1 Tax=Pelosinus sp. sgz500959 TaxID=3242472 RepID=UPI00366A7B32